MSVTAIYGEKAVENIYWNNISFEIVDCPATIWCGALEYAPNCTMNLILADC